MTLDEQLKYCRICENRKLNPAIGLTCGLTNEKPAFDITCANIKIDQPEADRLIKLEREAKEEEETSRHFSVPEKKAMKMGALGGMLMIIVAVVWFVLGLAADRIFFYPVFLFAIGIYTFIKELAKGNIAGKKS